MLSRFILFSFILAVSLSNTSFAISNYCDSIFSKRAPVKSSHELSYIDQATSHDRSEIATAKSESREAMRTIRHQSDKLMERFVGLKKIIELDVLCVGAGPACTAAAHSIPKNLRSKSLIIEGTNYVAKVFNNANFYINTPAQYTLIPEAKSTFNSTFKYPHSAQLASYLQRSLIESGVPTLLKVSITSIRLVTDAKGRVVATLLTTDKGLTFKVKQVLFGTGLGEGATKVQDPIYQELFNQNQELIKNNPTEFQKIMHSDAFLMTLKSKENSLTDDGIAKSLPSSIVLLGNGDGARITLEGIVQLSHFLPKNFKITWVGGDYKSAEDYLKSQSSFDRYTRLIPDLYNRNLIIGHEGRSSGVSISENGSVSVSIAKKSGELSKIIVENKDTVIIDATGYSQKIKVLETLPGETELKTVYATKAQHSELFDQQPMAIAKQVYIKGVSIPVHIIGAATGGLATPTETNGKVVKNPVAVENNVWRIRELLRGIFDFWSSGEN